MHLRRLLLAVLAALGLVACGGGAPVVRVTSPFTSSDATVFDQGVDFVDDPDILEGHWSEDWTREFQHRVGSSDLVEIVDVVSLRVATLPDQDPEYMIDIQPRRALLGDSTDVDLESHTGDSGYASIDSNQRRLASGSFLLFVKYATGPDGTIVAKWHLSPATDKILGHANDLLSARLHPHAQDQGTVIERNN